MRNIDCLKDDELEEEILQLQKEKDYRELKNLLQYKSDLEKVADLIHENREVFFKFFSWNKCTDGLNYLKNNEYSCWELGQWFCQFQEYDHEHQEKLMKKVDSGW